MIRDLYIQTVKAAVNGSLHGPQTVLVPTEGGNAATRAVAKALAAKGLVAAGPVTVPDRAYRLGEGWPSSRANVGESMIGMARLDNLEACVRGVLEDDVPGDLIETGVWRGGACVLMKAIVEAYEDGRTVYVADSFEGLPAPTHEADAGINLNEDPTLAVSVEQVRATFERYGLLDDRVKFVKGWFRDTLPALREHRWSLIRLDGDLYESTMDALVNLYPGLSSGGFCIIDDYGTYEACAKAVHDYRTEHGITEPIEIVDNSGAFWRKG